MSGAGFQFDSEQPFQLAAIHSVVGLFDGQPIDAEQLKHTLKGSATFDDGTQAAFEYENLAEEVGAIGNNLVLDRELVLANLQTVQDRNGLEVSSKLFDEEALDFDIEMETGTGKTYVYLRSIFELAQKYRFTKFVILVPSVAIREGVLTSINLMREHFRSLYPALPFDASVYSGKSAEEVQSFATSTNVQILVMTIDSIRGDANSRVIHQTRDKLNGLRPIDFLKATRPVVIMDEPQKMKTELSQSAIGELNPAFTLRYSATHDQKRNVVYRLDPVDAHEKGLVKQIVVAEVLQAGADATPYIKLISVKREPAWQARLELAVRNAAGSIERREVNVRQNQELSDERLTENPAYEGIWVSEMTVGVDGQPASVELNTHGLLVEGESIGGSDRAIYKEMIRETIREHFRKDAQLRPLGIKVLSLFFVDKVASYLGDGYNNETADGDFAKWFDEVFAEERAKSPKWQELLPHDPQELRKAYFSQIKRGKSVVMQDSTGKTKNDDDAYELIMRDKARLLDEHEPVRFIFSHSALREGWDNPNVFQICILREMGKIEERRQTLGRGLRLPVAQTADGFERVADRGIASLTVVAQEEYSKFADALQKEYKADGIEIGRVRKSEFSKLPRQDEHGALTDELFGYQMSVSVWEHLRDHSFIDAEGAVLPKFQPNQVGFSLGLPVDLMYAETMVIELVGRAHIGTYVKPKSKRQPRVLNKQLYATPEFEDFWDAISQKTTYRVQFDREVLITRTIAAVKKERRIEPLRIQVTKAGVKVNRGGAKGQELSTRSAELRGSYSLPDIITELQSATSLTRQTIVDILVGSGRLNEFIGNPNDVISMVKRVLLTELNKIVVDGIQYERIAGSVYELRELQRDGEQEKERFLDQMYRVQNTQKTDFDYVVFDSDVERQFAEKLDDREDIKMFMKLPPKFKVPTPVGDYNPDWAIVKHEDGQDRVYMIRETKGTTTESLLRPSEAYKIESAKKHFAAIGINDYAVAAPGAWNI